MKRLVSSILAISLFTIAQSQYVADAIRYSQNFPSITARSMSMGGAFTSLGGDFSSVYFNPAGLALYRSSEFVVSPGLGYAGVKSRYYAQNNEDYKYQFMFGNLGYVGNYTSGRDNGLVSASYAVGYLRLNNLSCDTYIRGINEYNSLADYFMDFANGTAPEYLEPFYERLAFDAYIIDTVPGAENEYQTPVFLPVGQRKTNDSKGGTGEWSFALGLNFSNVFHAGLGLGFQQLRYNQTMIHSEFDEYDYNHFNNFSFTEDLDVRGTGVSLKLGMMVRLLDVIRIGGSLHLPTFYRITEEYYNTLRSEFDDNSVYDIKPTDIEGNELSAGTFDYKLNTPLRAMGGASVQIGTFGIVAADVEFVDYSSMRLRESDDYTDFQESNREIESVYKPVLNIKAGGEVRLGNFSVRAGGGYYPSPYDAGELNKDADYAEFTTGLGYRDKNIFMDLGFSGLVHGEKYNLYWDNTADLDQFKYRLVLSLGIRL
ncbi:MAG: hypothetical protein JXB19_04440 [Bacteroidales bacterium]|nr:hypothetical protein [Bacteroidales bacterium]